MAGGQERILKRRIKTVESTKKITPRDGAHRGQPHRQGAAARACSRSLQRADHRGHRRTSRAAGAEINHPLLCPGHEVRREAYVVHRRRPWARRWLQLVGLRAAEREVKRTALEGKDYELVLVGRKAETYFRFRGLPHRRVVHAASPTSDVRGRQGDRLDACSGCSMSGEVDPVELVYTGFCQPAAQEVAAAPADPARSRDVEGGDAMPAGRWPRRPRSRTSSSRPRRDPRPPAATLRRGSPVRRAAQRVGVRARCPPAGHEGRHRQRGGPHQRLIRAMNRARQDAITTEIMEIVGRAEALSARPAAATTTCCSISKPPPR